ncbi:uncharacterized protein LOC130724839 [Lotus japonicus]|uniref:uncharacterized protein LOC130724839 n=1 Tax=Lotus japonicus TaxID=34305 RepID=UPI00258F4537|nr:uncharacterized protein LOC130724839 [Lotus japonicus]
MSRGTGCLHEWQEAQGTREATPENQSERIWKPPPEDRIKVNLDAGWTGSSSTGFGLVARDHNSCLLVAATLMDEFRSEATVAEAKAMRWCLATIRDMGMEAVIVESDSALVIRAMHSLRCRPDIDPLIHDCKELAKSFSFISFSHVNRTANNAAHVLASLANDFPSATWWDSPPQIVAEAMLVDAYSTH